jgi:auxin influx carrier (AUX1 LAX family)
MSTQKQAEEAMVSNNDTGHEEKEVSNDESGFSLKSVLWHGGSVYDAWFSCSSNQVLLHPVHNLTKKRENLFLNFDQEKMELSFWRSQVAQVLLTLPYSFSQMGMLSGIILQIFYGFLGSWTAYLISVLYVEYRSRKEKENVNFKNHVIQVSLPKTHNIRTKRRK